MSNPWLDPDIAPQQRATLDAQLQDWSKDVRSQPHFTALAEAVGSTRCPGSILEVGCGVGASVEILRRAGVPFESFTGQDISPRAIAFARERYPEAEWICAQDRRGLIAPGKFDVVIDGSCLLHVEFWKEHLSGLCAASRRWVILHRVPAGPTTGRGVTRGFGREFPAWTFFGTEISEEMAKHGFVPVDARTADGGSYTITYAKPRHYATYADRKYLGRLKALHASMVKHCGPFVLHVLAWSAEVASWCAEQGIEHMGAPRFLEKHHELAIDALPGPMRSTIEHYFTCGPAWCRDVMAQTGEPVTYVDSDIALFSSPEPVFAEIGGARAAVFPHNFAPASAGLPGPTIESHHIFGIQNCGLVYIADRGIAEDWAEQTRAWCFDRVEAMEGRSGRDVPILERRFRFGDQGFLSEWPEKYGARIVKHPGAALGPWAVHCHALDVRDGVVHFGNRPLVSYHYSGLRELPDGNSVATRPEYVLTERQERILYADYWRALSDGKQ